MRAEDFTSNKLDYSNSYAPPEKFLRRPAVVRVVNGMAAASLLGGVALKTISAASADSVTAPQQTAAVPAKAGATLRIGFSVNDVGNPVPPYRQLQVVADPNAAGGRQTYVSGDGQILTAGDAKLPNWTGINNVKFVGDPNVYRVLHDPDNWYRTAFVGPDGKSLTFGTSGSKPNAPSGAGAAAPGQPAHVSNVPATSTSLNNEELGRLGLPQIPSAAGHEWGGSMPGTASMSSAGWNTHKVSQVSQPLSPTDKQAFQSLWSSSPQKPSQVNVTGANGVNWNIKSTPQANGNCKLEVKVTYPEAPGSPQYPEQGKPPVGPESSKGTVPPEHPVGVTPPQGPVSPEHPVGVTPPQGPVSPEHPVGVTPPQSPISPEHPVGVTPPEKPLSPTSPEIPNKKKVVSFTATVTRSGFVFSASPAQLQIFEEYGASVGGILDTGKAPEAAPTPPAPAPSTPGQPGSPGRTPGAIAPGAPVANADYCTMYWNTLRADMPYIQHGTLSTLKYNSLTALQSACNTIQFDATEKAQQATQKAAEATQQDVHTLALFQAQHGPGSGTPPSTGGAGNNGPSQLLPGAGSPPAGGGGPTGGGTGGGNNAPNAGNPPPAATNPPAQHSVTSPLSGTRPDHQHSYVSHDALKRIAAIGAVGSSLLVLALAAGALISRRRKPAQGNQLRRNNVRDLFAKLPSLNRSAFVGFNRSVDADYAAVKDQNQKLGLGDQLLAMSMEVREQWLQSDPRRMEKAASAESVDPVYLKDVAFSGYQSGRLFGSEKLASLKDTTAGFARRAMQAARRPLASATVQPNREPRFEPGD